MTTTLHSEIVSVSELHYDETEDRYYLMVDTVTGTVLDPRNCRVIYVDLEQADSLLNEMTDLERSDYAAVYGRLPYVIRTQTAEDRPGRTRITTQLT